MDILQKIWLGGVGAHVMGVLFLGGLKTDCCKKIGNLSCEGFRIPSEWLTFRVVVLFGCRRHIYSPGVEPWE